MFVEFQDAQILMVKFQFLYAINEKQVKQLELTFVLCLLLFCSLSITVTLQFIHLFN